ncbi:MAG TPA: type III pantothenate kinase [Pedobacter sp.]|nr:type III pantothenate kinase [Pedobacter sp.]
MHNLVIDIGNTNHKLAVFYDRELVDYQIVSQITTTALTELIQKYSIECSTISSVAANLSEVVEVLKRKTKYVPFSTGNNTGIKNYYHSLTTLGLDRWAKVIAANYYHPGRDCFMIDAGTCITYDLLNSRSEYFGGSISPGIHMRFEALNHYTGRLPLVEWDKKTVDIPKGSDTVTAIKNGVLQGVIHEVEGFIAHQASENIGLAVVITGGDAGFLLEQLKNSIFAPQIIHDPYLVLKGLNEVIAFEHVQKN